MILVPIYIENIDELIEDYNQIRLYRDTIPNGSFSEEIDTESLVEGVTLYELSDSTGTPNQWYVYDLYNTDSAVSTSQSPPFQTQGVTLRHVRMETAIEAGAGFRGTCTATGDVDELTDVALSDSGVDSSFLEGAWLYRPKAVAAGDRLRRVSSFNTGSLVPSRNWTNAPASGEQYEVFNLLPPVDAPGVAMSYDRVIRSALSRCWFVDEIVIGQGTEDGKDRFDVSSWPITKETLRGLLIRQYDQNTGYAIDRDAGILGRFYEYRDNGLESFIDVMPPPGNLEYLVAQVNRAESSVYRDDDLVMTPLDLAVKASVFELFLTMERMQPGKFAGELNVARANYDDASWKHTPSNIVRGL